MKEKPPFDTVKWSFLLVAAVIGVHCIVVLAGVVFCWVYFEQLPPQTRCENLRGQLIEMLAGALAAVLAFAGGFSKRDK